MSITDSQEIPKSPKTEISRRGFLKLLGLGIAGITASGCAPAGVLPNQEGLIGVERGTIGKDVLANNADAKFINPNMTTLGGPSLTPLKEFEGINPDSLENSRIISLRLTANQSRILNLPPEDVNILLLEYKIENKISYIPALWLNPENESIRKVLQKTQNELPIAVVKDQDLWPALFAKEAGVEFKSSELKNGFRINRSGPLIGGKGEQDAVIRALELRPDVAENASNGLVLMKVEMPNGDIFYQTSTKGVLPKGYSHYLGRGHNIEITGNSFPNFLEINFQSMLEGNTGLLNDGKVIPLIAIKRENMATIMGLIEKNDGSYSPVMMYRKGMTEGGQWFHGFAPNNSHLPYTGAVARDAIDTAIEMAGQEITSVAVGSAKAQTFMRIADGTWVEKPALEIAKTPINKLISGWVESGLDMPPQKIGLLRSPFFTQITKRVGNILTAIGPINETISIASVWKKSGGDLPSAIVFAENQMIPEFSRLQDNETTVRDLDELASNTKGKYLYGIIRNENPGGVANTMEGTCPFVFSADFAIEPFLIIKPLSKDAIYRTISQDNISEKHSVLDLNDNPLEIHPTQLLDSNGDLIELPQEEDWRNKIKDMIENGNNPEWPLSELSSFSEIKAESTKITLGTQVFIGVFTGKEKGKIVSKAYFYVHRFSAPLS